MFDFLKMDLPKPEPNKDLEKLEKLTDLMVRMAKNIKVQTEIIKKNSECMINVRKILNDKK